jgi:hypothetical protein
MRAAARPDMLGATRTTVDDMQRRGCRELFANQEAAMPLYIIERNFAEQLELDDDAVVALSKINGDVGVNWLFSFLSADKRKTYCLYEAKDPESIREAARRANVPADKIVEVSQAFGASMVALQAAGVGKVAA